MESGTGNIQRRTLVRGAAWAVPAVTLATAAPAYAVSTCGEGALEVLRAAMTYTLNLHEINGNFGWFADNTTHESEATQVFLNFRNDAGYAFTTNMVVNVAVRIEDPIPFGAGPHEYPPCGGTPYRTMNALTSFPELTSTVRDSEWLPANYEDGDSFTWRHTNRAIGAGDEPDIRFEIQTNFFSRVCDWTLYNGRTATSLDITVQELEFTQRPSLADIAARNPEVVSVSPACQALYDRVLAESPFRVQYNTPSSTNPYFEEGVIGRTYNSKEIGNSGSTNVSSPDWRNNGVF